MQVALILVGIALCSIAIPFILRIEPKVPNPEL